MKKILILIMGLLIISCSNDDANNNADLNKKTTLSSITRNYYTNDNRSASDQLFFIDEKLSVIRYMFGTYDEYQYNSENLLVKISTYHPNSTLLLTKNFLYDSMGRIIQIEEIPNSDYTTNYNFYKITFVYETNRIVGTLFKSKSTYNNKYEFLLDSNNKITTNKWIGSNDIVSTNPDGIEYFYINGNLTNVLPSQAVGKKDDVTITYSTLKNEYNYKKNMFGKHWKNNNYLAQMHAIYNKPLISFAHYFDETEISENLILSYDEKFYDISLNVTVMNVTVDYEFNEKNQFLKEVRNYSRIENGDNQTSKLELIYEYK